MWGSVCSSVTLAVKTSLLKVYAGWEGLGLLVGLAAATDLNFEMSNPILIGGMLPVPLRPMGGVSLFASETGARAGREFEGGVGNVDDEESGRVALLLLLLSEVVAKAAKDDDDDDDGGIVVPECAGEDAMEGVTADEDDEVVPCIGGVLLKSWVCPTGLFAGCCSAYLITTCRTPRCATGRVATTFRKGSALVCARWVSPCPHADTAGPGPDPWFMAARSSPLATCVPIFPMR